MTKPIYTGSKPDKKPILLLMLAVLSLMLWLVPAAFGKPSPNDGLVALCWLFIVGIALIVLVVMGGKKRSLMHTVYVDEESHRGFNPYVGTFACGSSKQLIDRLIVLFPHLVTGTKQTPQFDIPEGFTPSLIVETSIFTYRRDTGTKLSTPIEDTDDVTVETWEGRVVNAQTGHSRPFTSLFELEELF